MTLVFVLTAVFALLFAGCGDDSGGKTGDTKGPVTVSSKKDTEGGLLGQMIIHVLEADGFEVVDKTKFGTTGVMRKALINDEVDIYIEYTANGKYFFESDKDELWNKADTAYSTVKKLDMEANNIIWLKPANANNTWAIAAREDLVEREGVRTLEDFADYVKTGGDVVLVCSQEFVDSEAALPAFEQAYGFDLSDDQLIILAGGNTAQTEKAAAEQTNGANFAMAYGTDGALSAFNLVVLEDTLNVQPVYQPAPIVRGEVYEMYPEMSSLLNPVFDSLDLETLQSLNGQIAVEGKTSAEVARAYLTENGFIE